ncbi:MAG: ribbon-helix-helix protein, CopG family [Legionellales bacterium]|nr:ribbon-helix-helix protein, CopG family [Legionellales bacterium]
MNTQLSITLPDTMANASSRAARHLGISRTAFIRQAIAHELAILQKKEEIEGITRALLAMQADPTYQETMEFWDNTTIYSY